ncbi:MAG: hypothetical protein OEQ49_14490 [Myxococcales bacterium]|nr:hypothetical protein [Myxococcales bacterium]
MKPVRVLFLAISTLAVAGCGTNTDEDAQKCDVNSTFAQIQEQVFEARGCTESNCHGDSPQSGLDLRADVAYENLINVVGVAGSGDLKLVSPLEEELSVLYLKVRAKADGSSLSAQGIGGGAMPVGGDVLSDDDLGLLRAWIRGGAPETGIVKGSEEFATCALEGEIVPNKIQPLAPPAADEGVQFYSGAWPVPAQGEGEVCFVSYYDYSDSIPEGLKVPCKDAQGGPDRDCFAYNEILLAQDPQSHHSIVEFYVPPQGKEAQWDPTNGAEWKNWVCLGGESDGASCTPGSDECGDRSQCVTAPITTVACIIYGNGPDELGTPLGLFGIAQERQNIATAQEATFRERYPTDVYSLIPVQGFIVWDSHAFNLTESDTTVEQWMNVEFAAPEAQVYERRQIFDAGDIFSMGMIEAFTSNEVCTSYTIPQHARLLTLSTHTHRYGKRFRVWYPPNDSCAPGPDCLPEERDPDYISRDYADPLYQRFFEPDLPVYDSPDPRERTFKYCSLWDNGETNPEEVRRESTKPDAETCDFVAAFRGFAAGAGFEVFACGCAPEERSCFGGPNQGMACNGDDSLCGDGGICDACPTGGGVTTEEDMFILLGSYFVQAP